MNTRKNMIIVKGEIKTPEIKKCEYNPVSKMMDVEYLKGGKYSYGYSKVEWLRDPEVLNPNMYRISRAGCVYFVSQKCRFLVKG